MGAGPRGGMLRYNPTLMMTSRIRDPRLAVSDASLMSAFPFLLLSNPNRASVKKAFGIVED